MIPKITFLFQIIYPRPPLIADWSGMSPCESTGKTDFLPLFGRRNINCGCSSSKCSLKPGVGKMKILFRVLENQSTWSILFSLPFPPLSPATSSWGGRTSHQHQGESKTSLAVPTAFGHCWEGSDLPFIFKFAICTSRQVYSKQHQVWLPVWSIAWQPLYL